MIQAVGVENLKYFISKAVLATNKWTDSNRQAIDSKQESGLPSESIQTRPGGRRVCYQYLGTIMFINPLPDDKF